jgi:hypothetical protein
MVMLLAALLLAGQSQTVQHGRVNEPIVQVGLFSYHADGTAAGSAFGTSDRLESIVFASASLCQLGAGFRDLPATAAHAWKFTGRVVSATSESAVVQLEWQRTMNEGADVSEAPTSVQLTLKAGDRVLLDSVAPQTTRGCSVTSAGFEARYVARSAGLRHQFTPWAGGGGAGTGIGTGAGTGTGGGFRTGSSSGTGSGSGSGGGAPAAGAGGRALSGSRVLGVPGENLDPDSLNVELWLVRSVPGSEDRSLYQALRSSREGAMFAFAPVPVTTPEGVIGVQVSGSFSVQGGGDGDRLIFVVNRRVSYSAAGAELRDRSAEGGNSGRIVRRMPRPDEVLSFELPQLEAAHGHSAVPDRFSVRVRIRPAGGV